MRRAVIDVGTNSVKLLVAEVHGHTLEPLVERSRQTRLGRGFYEDHLLQPRAIAETAQAVAEFCAQATALNSQSVRVIATSAVRDARNQGVLLAEIQQASGLKVEVISGEQEAEWVFRGVATNAALAGGRLMILDVGGGSTEIILGEGQHHTFRQSFPLGSVRLMEKLKPPDPPTAADLANCRKWLGDFFNGHIAPALEQALQDHRREAVHLVGTGGTTSILARMEGRMSGFDRKRIDGLRLTHNQVRGWVEHLWSLALAERKEIVGLPSNRADIILMGAAIYEAVMDHFSFSELYVSTRGLRFGALLDG